MIKKKSAYHHGDLAESLLNAVDEIASQFGLEAVTLRACAKRVGVSPSSAFRHYKDKRALLTAFATRALQRLDEAMQQAANGIEQKRTDDDTHLSDTADSTSRDAFAAVGLAYVQFAIDNPALFRAMWREETIYTGDASYQQATTTLSNRLKGGFAASIHDDDPDALSNEELLAWSSVHGLAHLFVDGPIGRGQSHDEKLQIASEMIQLMKPALDTQTL